MHAEQYIIVTKNGCINDISSLQTSHSRCYNHLHYSNFSPSQRLTMVLVIERLYGLSLTSRNRMLTTKVFIAGCEPLSVTLTVML